MADKQEGSAEIDSLPSPPPMEAANRDAAGDTYGSEKVLASVSGSASDANFLESGGTVLDETRDSSSSFSAPPNSAAGPIENNAGNPTTTTISISNDADDGDAKNHIALPPKDSGHRYVLTARTYDRCKPLGALAPCLSPLH